MAARFALFLGLIVLWSAATQAADEATELTVKRQAIFEFTEKPKLTRKDRSVLISFAVKAACDVTIAIEDLKGVIQRHLVSGVLGDNAPAPFKKGSLQQTILWDGKDDAGDYVSDLETMSVRVSLGLNPQFEKSLFDEPKRRYSCDDKPLLCATKEGVYVYDGGNSIDFLKLYDHDGNYVRTIYPFPADKIKDVKGLFWHDYADGKHLPIKPNFPQDSLLTAGTQSFKLMEYNQKENIYQTREFDGYCHFGIDGRGGMALGVRNGRVALAHMLLNRFGTDGSSDGMTLTGPCASFQVKAEGSTGGRLETDIPPHSVALDPKGKTLYLTNYVFSHKQLVGSGAQHHAKWGCFHGVFKLNMDDDSGLVLFAGSQKLDDAGTDNAHFNVPASLAVDDSGQVYVADYMNDRIQVFNAGGTYQRTIKTPKPAQIRIDPVHGELIVISYLLINAGLQTSKEKFPATLTRLGPLANPVKIAAYPLPLQSYIDHIEYHYYGSGDPLCVEYDAFGPNPVIWISEEYQADNVVTAGHAQTNLRLYEIKDNNLCLKRDFMDEVTKSVVRVQPPRNFRQRLNVDPTTGKLYVCEAPANVHTGEEDVHSGFTQLVEIDPETSKISLVEAPFDVEDLCFDRDGLVYVRDFKAIARYDLHTPGAWREVPWDYGDEYNGNTGLSANCNSGRRVASVSSALSLPANGGWHSGGMFVSKQGNLVATCNYTIPALAKDAMIAVSAAKEYQPAVYPGRAMSGRGGGVFIHIWDKHGKLKCEDAVWGIADNTYGLGLDADNNIYALIAATRYYNGKRYFNDMSGTLCKFQSMRTKVISDSDDIRKVPVPLPKASFPQRPADFGNGAQGNAWIESGAEWLFGGVGFCGKNVGIGCACVNCRFAFDYFDRSFAPEIDRYSVAILDSNGNLITRVGQYGNRDSAGAQSLVPLGGDEVGLFYGAYIAVHTDKRLFIADPGNGRIVSVRLNYHVSETIMLHD